MNDVMRPRACAPPSAPGLLWPGWRARPVCLAVAADLTIPSNLLFVMDMDYSAPGGFKLLKFHPATGLIFASLTLVCLRHRRPGRRLRLMLRTQPAANWMTGSFLLCMLYYIVSLGTSGVSVYVENFIAAGVFALLAGRASAAQARVIASGSNALARKSNILVLLVAALFAMRGSTGFQLRRRA